MRGKSDLETSNYDRTDLACEWGRQNRMASETVSGIQRSGYEFSHGRVEVLRICDENAAHTIGRPCGAYMTVSCARISSLDHEGRGALEEQIARLLLRLLCQGSERRLGGAFSVLVVGLGNRQITADAIGPRVVDELLVTRHLKEQEPKIYAQMGCCAVSALSPGVLGQSGMEAAEVVAGAVRRCAPDAVIAIDSLAARSCERLACTVQLTDTGISPGSGIGNGRQALTKQHLGVPVIGLGIPTVVDSSTLVYDALQRAGIRQIDERLRQILDNGRRFYVSPKEADQITGRTASLIARAINRALVGVPTLQ